MLIGTNYIVEARKSLVSHRKNYLSFLKASSSPEFPHKTEDGKHHLLGSGGVRLGGRPGRLQPALPLPGLEHHLRLLAEHLVRRRLQQQDVLQRRRDRLGGRRVTHGVHGQPAGPTVD